MLGVFKKKKAEKVMQRENTVKLGEKTVRIEKITPRQYRELFSVMGNIPNLVINVFNAPENEYTTYLLTALEVGLDDLVEVTSHLTGIDRDYLFDKAGLDDLTGYLARMVEYNNLEQTLKNVKSLLPKAKKMETETAA